MFKLDVLERFHKDVKRDFHPATSIKINRSEMDLLIILNEVPNKSFKFYGHHIHLEKSSFSYVVDLLAIKGFVIKEEDELDKRKKTLVLTEAGKNIVNELNHQYEAYYQQRMSIFNETELSELKKAVKTIDAMSKKLKKHIDSDDNKERFDHHFDRP